MSVTLADLILITRAATMHKPLRKHLFAKLRTGDA